MVMYIVQCTYIISCVIRDHQKTTDLTDGRGKVGRLMLLWQDGVDDGLSFGLSLGTVACGFTGQNKT